MSFLVSNTVILLYCNGVGGIILFEYSTSVVDSLSPVLHLYCVLRYCMYRLVVEGSDS